MDTVSGSDVAAQVRTHLQTVLGQDDPSSASVTFLGLEPLHVLLFSADNEGVVRFATLGCSRHPMADPSDMVTDSQRGPRAELILALRGVDESVAKVWRTLAVFAASPAVEGIVLVPDALLDAGEPLWPGAPFTAVLLTAESGVGDLDLPEPYDPVRFLRAVPITGTEAAWVRLRGADALRDAWTEAEIDIADPRRSAASLRPPT
ncbi:suppressor of fused domain protein [Rhodococcus sp. BP-349]|uniref:suppressor of fused domain protein n=1 Tax=unclassified Rhodococcus (in: high G+C Gram-positive bacteria) TaxID=192944 RepID=UPI001C9B97C5|nr:MULTISPECIES: suppressor of fused domain protein [unclassified Rhodococcus (in: high G+C Gram-positive bacteria)]MBY6538682.1 suppressor of fused domain protein [Rhodococcus sp. BP-363]MBY6543019.1 suppressor of fused domain protein [Rhodococcus sp. BP-369]MBY6562249.1 suppressor of fused domain protein [Rhodococcus sp. BP-370]MBY6576541.1 suppressor of fused domain protein [Rhodococcus sp. BP-364]MBY6585842.1 suppressor of fused domain protein [Rhodococcus sp. BP-358]